MAWTTPTTVSTGDVLTASRYNADVQANMTELAPLFAAWTSFTPTLAQGASTNITKTVTYAKYVQVGKLVIANYRIASTSTGTAGSAITLTLPVTAKDSGYAAGVFSYTDASPFAVYAGYVYLTSTTVFGGQVASAASDLLLGAGPAVTVASGDTINAHLVYEAA